MVKEQLMQIISSDSDTELNAKCEIINQLQGNFQTSTNRSERVQILTVLPKSWNIRSIECEFVGATNFMKQKAKQLKEKRIMSTPNPKPGKLIEVGMVNLVREFYESHNISHIIEKKFYGFYRKKDFMSVRQIDGTRVHVQKRLVLNNLKELYTLFKEKFPGHLGFSKLAEKGLGKIPKHCVLF